MDKVRVGVIGCGSVSDKYIPHVRRLGLESVPTEIVVACDVNPAAEDKVRTRFGIKNFTSNYKDVLDRDDVDVVLVLTSMQEHGKLTIEALEAGKHVLVEKPMSMSLPEAADIVQLARESKGHLVCAPHVIHSPTYQNIWRLIQEGRIGKILSGRGLYGWAGPSWGPWFYEPGGGAMFDLGVYNVTTLTGLIGPAKRVMAMSGIAIPERVVDNRKITVRTDDNAQLLLDFGDQCYAVVTTGFTLQKYRAPGLELYGTEGTVQMIGEDWDPRGYELWENSRGCWQVFEQRSSWPWSDGVRDMIAAIHEGRKPLGSPEHAYHVLEIMTKAAESGRTGQALPIESTFTPPTFATAAEGVAAHLDHDPT